MRSTVSLTLGSLGILTLLACSSSSNNSGPVSSYLVNAIAVGDLDGNGLPDILGVVSRDVDGQPAQGYVSTRLQNPDGSFVLPTRFGLGRAPANLAIADVDGDGRLDLVAANAEDQTVSVRLGDPTRPGFFLPALVLATPNRTPLDVAVGDLNGDGLPDLAVATSAPVGSTSLPVTAAAVTVFLQIVPINPAPSTVSFGPSATFTVAGDPQAVLIADLEGDGRQDLAVATATNSVSVLLQTPAGTLASATDFPTGIQPVAIKAADLNGDGLLDLVTANFGAALSPNNQGLSVLLQTTPGTFAAPMHYPTGYRASALAVGDLNGDGKPDIAVACAGLPGDPGAVSVLLHTAPAAAAPGTYLGAVNYPGAWGPMGVAIADMDGDGLPDLVVADGDITVRFNRTTVPGTFDPPRFFYN